MTNKLIVGLGNPGDKYKTTRHNAGFMVVDALVSQIANSQWSMAKKFNSFIDYQSSIIFCKPQTFMNASGVAVAKLATYYKLPAAEIFVIHDDLDIKLGEYKIQKGVGPKLHYGVESIERALGTKDFWRVRVGVENREIIQRTPGEEYVLQNFKEDEFEILKNIIEKIIKDLVILIDHK